MQEKDVKELEEESRSDKKKRSIKRLKVALIFLAINACSLCIFGGGFIGIGYFLSGVCEY